MKRYILRNIVPAVVRVVVFFFGSRNRKSPDASNFFFIIGSGRNGSTLLSSILNNHPEIFIPPEQYVIPFFATRWQLNRKVNHSEFFKKFSEQLLMPRKTVNWELKEEDYNKLNKSNLWSSFFEMIAKIFHFYAYKKGKSHIKMIGEKSPLMIHYWRLFYPEFIGSKYIFLVRDPRDVIYSFSKVDGHEANDLSFAIWKWKDSVLQFNQLRKLTDETITIKYEDLAKNPEVVLSKIYEFLGLDFDLTTIQSPKDSSLLGVNRLAHHQNLSKPINPESIGKWRGHFTNAEVEKIKRELTVIADEFGYNLSD